MNPQQKAVIDFLGTSKDVLIGVINASAKGGNVVQRASNSDEITIQQQELSLETLYSKVSDLFPQILKLCANDSLADSIPPMWFNLNRWTEVPKPVAFEGNVDAAKLLQSDTQHRVEYFYAAHQIIRKWDSPTICAILGSKKLWNSKGDRKTKNLIDTSVCSTSDVEYLRERGAITEFGEKSNEFVRWVVPYTTPSGKNAFILISGDNDFLNGSVDIIPQFKFLTSFKLRKQQEENTHVELTSEACIYHDPQDLNLIGQEIGVVRYLVGAILTHDYMQFLKKKMNVTTAIEIDSATKGTFKKVSIDDIINNYSKVKKFLTVLNAYKFIG